MSDQLIRVVFQCAQSKNRAHFGISLGLDLLLVGTHTIQKK